jgi:hypothetical protein
LQRLRSPTLREIAIAVAAPLIVALIAFGANELWKALHKQEPTGTIDYKGTIDAFVSRVNFYRRFVHKPALTSAGATYGAVFLVQTTAQHTSNCRLKWTAMNVGDQQTVGGLVDRPTSDVAPDAACDGEKRVWIRWPCVPSETELQFEIDLVAGSKDVDSTATKTFTIGGSC